MKKLAFFSGATFLSLTILGMLFKLMHWPGAGVILILGVAGLTLLAIPVVAMYKYKKA